MISGIYKSIIKSTVDLIEVLKDTTGDPNIQYWSWESRADENALPKNTLLGIDGFTFEENKGLWVVRYALALSTFQDANLMNEIDMVDIIHQNTGERKKVLLLDPVSGEEQLEMVVVAWVLAPMAQSQLRNYRTMSIELLKTAPN